MHEISLINSVVQTLEQQFTDEELSRLNQIDMQIGVFSNIEPLLMQNAFDAVCKTQNKFKGVKLEVESIPVKIFCESCQVYSIIKNYVFVCSKCNQPNNNLVEGTEMLIKRVHFDDK